MTRKKKKRNTDAKKPAPTVPGSAPTKPVEDEPATENDPLDFGGLPARDLKKNLGCGS